MGWTWFGLTAFLQKTARTGELLFDQMGVLYFWFRFRKISETLRIRLASEGEKRG